MLLKKSEVSGKVTARADSTGKENDQNIIIKHHHSVKKMQTPTVSSRRKKKNRKKTVFSFKLASLIISMKTKQISA